MASGNAKWLSRLGAPAYKTVAAKVNPFAGAIAKARGIGSSIANRAVGLGRAIGNQASRVYSAVGNASLALDNGMNRLGNRIGQHFKHVGSGIAARFTSGNTNLGRMGRDIKRGSSKIGMAITDFATGFNNNYFDADMHGNSTNKANYNGTMTRWWLNDRIAAIKNIPNGPLGFGNSNFKASQSNSSRYGGINTSKQNPFKQTVQQLMEKQQAAANDRYNSNPNYAAPSSIPSKTSSAELVSISEQQRKKNYEKITNSAIQTTGGNTGILENDIDKSSKQSVEAMDKAAENNKNKKQATKDNTTGKKDGGSDFFDMSEGLGKWWEARSTNEKWGVGVGGGVGVLALGNLAFGGRRRDY